jgi:hypothetical protein
LSKKKSKLPAKTYKIIPQLKMNKKCLIIKTTGEHPINYRLTTLYRVVSPEADKHGNYRDLIQPWSTSKKEAIESATSAGYQIIEEAKE